MTLPDPSTTTRPPAGDPVRSRRPRAGDRPEVRRRNLAALVERLSARLADVDPNDDPLEWDELAALIELAELELARPAVAR